MASAAGTPRRAMYSPMVKPWRWWFPLLEVQAITALSRGGDVQYRRQSIPEPAGPELIQSRQRPLVPDLVGHEEIEHGGPGQVGVDVK